MSENPSRRNVKLENHVSSYEKNIRQVASSQSQPSKVSKPPDRPMTLSKRFAKARSDQKARILERLTQFISEFVEPLLEAQASSGTSKMIYALIPSDSGNDHSYLQSVIRDDYLGKENFLGHWKNGATSQPFKTKIPYKIVKLVGREYALNFWQESSVIETLQKTLVARLEANGERIAGKDFSWSERSFQDGAKLATGCMGVFVSLAQLRFKTDGKDVMALKLLVEIT